eukprot:Em0023g912a
MTEYKVVLLGARRAGKSALGTRFAKNQFVVQDIQTVEDLLTKKAEIDNEICCLEILDTCGTARFSQIKQQHIRYGEGFVFVFAADNKRSFEEIEIIREQIYKGKKSCSVPIILVANKTDLPNHEVDLKQAEEYAEMHNMIYVEASAKTGQGTNDIFRLLVHEIRNKVTSVC